jgi:hypothetical protein
LDNSTYCDTQTHCQVTAALIGHSKTSVAREQLCGHVVYPVRKHAIMEEKFSLLSASYSRSWYLKPGIFRESIQMGTSAIGIRYQPTASEDWVDFLCAIVTVIFGVNNSERLS